MRPEEIAAARIVAQQLDGEVTARDVPDAPDATHDFDVVLPDGLRIALEVTSAADTELLSMRSAAYGKTCSAPSLRTNWWISFDGSYPVEIKAMMRGVEGQLRVLEEHDVTEVGTLSVQLGFDTPSAVTEATRQVLAGRITRAGSLGPPAPGEFAQMLLSSHRGLSSGLGQVNALVVDAAAANVEKLLAADADERHLFVWIDEDEAELEMFTLPPPASTPLLPDAIDVVWAATRGKAPGALFERLWQLRPPGGWEAISA